MLAVTAPKHQACTTAMLRISIQDVELLLGGSLGPGKPLAKGKSPEGVRGGCKRAFRPGEQRSPKSFLHHQNPLCWTQGAKVSQESFAPPKASPSDPGSKGLPRVFCTTQNLFCTGATSCRTSARGFLLVGFKKICCTLSKPLWRFSLFRQFPRPVPKTTLCSCPASTDKPEHVPKPLLLCAFGPPMPKPGDM